MEENFKIKCYHQLTGGIYSLHRYKSTKFHLYILLNSFFFYLVYHISCILKLDFTENYWLKTTGIIRKSILTEIISHSVTYLFIIAES